MPSSKLQKTVMKKLCATKKWLAHGDYRGKSEGKAQHRTVMEIFGEQPPPVYQNIPLRCIDPGIEKNAVTEDKLKSAINSFDKILDEYSRLKNEKPKLQKAKTCSIIESKCVFKKDLADKAFQSLDLPKTSSLQDLNEKTVDINFFLSAKTNQPKKVERVVPMPRTNHLAKTKLTKSASCEGGKVKDVVMRLNSLADTPPVRPARSKDIERDRSIEVVVEKPPKAQKPSAIPRASSYIDVNIQKRQPSRIPISLNKTFPSTPTGLNIDRNSGCAKNQPLQRAPSQQGFAQKSKKAQITRSMSNLKINDVKISRKQPAQRQRVPPKKIDHLDRCLTTGKKLIGRVEALQKHDGEIKKIVQKLETAKSSELHQVTKSRGKVENVTTIKNQSVAKDQKYQTMTITKDQKLQAKDKKLQTNNTITRDQKILSKTNDQRYQTITVAKQSEPVTFGEKKSLYEPKFGGDKLTKPSAVLKTPVRRTDTYTKSKAINKMKNDITAAKMLITDIYQDGSGKTPDAEFQKPKKSDSGIVLNECGKDYSSDDNSDDSGNISNGAEDSKVYSSVESLSAISPGNNGKIFFRSGVLTELEAQRDERLAGMVINLQAHCRGYLARKKLAHKKLQDLAVRCIQRNVRKFMLVRDWPWWRLLVRVTPLLNVHRTEEELKQKSEELELLKSKLDKIEAERTTLKHENDKLEAKLSEMTADYAEEHSTSTLAAERLDAETSERVRLERELSETQHKNKQLQQASERLEMELLYARSDLNGINEEDEDGDGDGVYKQRYERAIKELEFTKRRLQQQHEDDLEQLVALKKQLEKKLTDAYEEVEEQRQVVGQWKRKVQKLTGEMNDLKLLLEEQNSRNNLLEKKQRKFDSETQLLQDELRQERQAKERLSREKEVIIAEKFTLESNLADVKMELEMKEEKLLATQTELDEITFGGKTEEEVTLLRKQKIECERRLHDQEEELDELAGQVQLLEQAKLKLEMNLEQMRKSSKKEAAQHEEELEEVRCSAQKKVKTLEAQLENEHDERTILLREKHELERRLVAALENDRNDKACDEAVFQRLKRDLKRTKVLLRDTQTQLERQKAENPGKIMIRQLRNQLEDVECARAVAVKAKQSLEAELSETQALLDECNKQKSETEDRLNSVNRERNDMQSQLEENEEELAEVLKKYKATVSQMSLDQLALQEQVSLVSELEIERNTLKEQLAELTTKLESVESMGDASSHLLVKRTELKVKELESKLDLEQTTKSRLEVQIARLKEAVDKLQTDVSNARTKEQAAQDQIRKLQRNLRELRDEHNNTLMREGEALLKRKELEKRCEALECETSTARTDLRLALKRIEDLQSAIQGELDDDSIENSDSEHDSYSSDDSVNTFLANHKVGLKTERPIESTRRLSAASRSSTSSNLGKDGSYA